FVGWLEQSPTAVGGILGVFVQTLRWLGFRSEMSKLQRQQRGPRAAACRTCYREATATRAEPLRVALKDCLRIKRLTMGFRMRFSPLAMSLKNFQIFSLAI